MNQNFYLAIDGNRTGSRLERYILSNDMDGLRNFSNSVSAYVNNLMFEIEQNQGIIYMSGGDNILAEVNSSCIPKIQDMIVSFAQKEYYFSMSIGNSALDAYLGLKYAKCTGDWCVFAEKSSDGQVRFQKYVSTSY